MDFDRFFEQHYEPIVRSLTAAFGQRSGVEEAVQDGFVKAHARWRRIRRYDAPAAWVRRVAINKLHDQRRTAERRQRAEMMAWDLAAASAPHAGQRTGTLVELIGTLPARQRLAMALHYVEDLPVREIAESMRISEGAVKAHLSQGRANLAAEVRERSEEGASVDA